MNYRTIDLANTIHWDQEADDKAYMESVRLTVALLPFANRQVFVRFVDGPALDLSIWDMDHLMRAYQDLRESVAKEVVVQKPPPCDFTVPIRHTV
jgi:hypothetical protein